MRELVHLLCKNRVRPYYIYICDLSMGIEHFRTPVSKGIEIIEGLRGHTSGYAVPTFVVDAPGGGGKTPVMPQYVISQTPHKVILRNYEGIITTYTEPLPDLPCNCDYCTGKKTYKYQGVSALGEGPEIKTIEPAHLCKTRKKQTLKKRRNCASIGRPLSLYSIGVIKDIQHGFTTIYQPNIRPFRLSEWRKTPKDDSTQLSDRGGYRRGYHARHHIYGQRRGNTGLANRNRKTARVHGGRHAGCGAVPALRSGRRRS